MTKVVASNRNTRFVIAMPVKCWRAAVLNEIYHVLIKDFIQLDPIVNTYNSIQSHQFK